VGALSQKISQKIDEGGAYLLFSRNGIVVLRQVLLFRQVKTGNSLSGVTAAYVPNVKRIEWQGLTA
jgi:hypothetical protein